MDNEFDKLNTQKATGWKKRDAKGKRKHHER